MAGNQQKTPVVKTLNTWARDMIQQAQDLLGKSVPAVVDSVDATGTIVTVNLQVQSQFPLLQVTCPVATTEFARAPIQNGTKGYLVPADFFLGGMTGLGDGQATFTQQANLTNSVFVPLGNSGFSPMDDGKKYLLYGPNGVIIRDAEKKLQIEIDLPSGEILLTTEHITVTVSDALGLLAINDGKAQAGPVLGGNLVSAVDDAAAIAQGVPLYGFYMGTTGNPRPVYINLTPPP